MVVNAILLPLPLIDEARCYQIVLRAINQVCDVLKMDITLDKGTESTYFNVYHIRCPGTRIEGQEQFVVHVVPGKNGWRQLDLTIWIGFIPEVSLGAPILAVGIDECPEAQFGGASSLCYYAHRR